MVGQSHDLEQGWFHELVEGDESGNGISWQSEDQLLCTAGGCRQSPEVDGFAGLECYAPEDCLDADLLRDVLHEVEVAYRNATGRYDDICGFKRCHKDFPGGFPIVGGVQTSAAVNLESIYRRLKGERV